MNKKKFHPVRVGNITLDNKRYVIQSMTNTKTSSVGKTLKQIQQLYQLGCQIVRIAIIDEYDLNAIKKIVKKSPCPLIGDIQYDINLAIKAIEKGLAGVRINPGNTPLNQLNKLLEVAKKHRAVIRFGINTGSLPKDIKTNSEIIALFRKYITYCGRQGFFNLVLSAKSTDLKRTIRLNQLLANNFQFPIHIGLTEAGPMETSVIRSTLALTPLIQKHIGSTIRISITGDPCMEPIVAKILLNELGYPQNMTNVIACPTCGRTNKNFYRLYPELMKFIYLNPKKNKIVAIMGCAVNGINEAKQADLGIFCNQDLLTVVSHQRMMGNDTYREGVKKFKRLYQEL